VEVLMSDSANGVRRLGRLTLRTCARGLVIAVLSVVPGIPRPGEVLPGSSIVIGSGLRSRWC
jgi:hypothetical protein